MPTDIGNEERARRIQDLYATDAQFAAARPDEAISAAIERPGVRLAQLVRTVMGATPIPKVSTWGWDSF
jgi:fatty acid CoA ligase FadD9